MFVLARNESLHLVGLVMLGLSVYAPISLLTGFNLRNRVAVDAEEIYQKSEVFALRLLTSTAALFLTGFLIFFYTDDVRSALVAFFFVATRLSDQLADVSVGFYQRDGELERIAKSLFFRSLSQVLPFIVVYSVDIDVLWASVVAAILSLMTVMYIDGGLKGGMFASVSGVTKPLFVGGVKASLQASVFPFLDSVYVNSLRYAAALFLTADSVGRIGVAQTLYAPLAMFITALGYGHLSRSSSAAKSQDWGLLLKLLIKASVIGMSVVLVATVVLYIIPDGFYSLVGLKPESMGRDAAVFVFLGLAPLAANGFACQTLLSAKLGREYSLNPMVGIFVFMLALAAVVYILGFNFQSGIFVAYFAGSCARVVHASLSIFAARRSVFS